MKKIFLTVIDFFKRIFGKTKKYDEIVSTDTESVLNYTGPYYEETEVIKDYYKHTLTSSKLQDTGEDVFNWVFKTVINKLTNSMLPGQIYDILIKGNQPNYLQNILDTLENVEKKIDELSHKTTMFKYEDVINARNNYVSKMNNAQLETNEKLYATDSSDEESIKKILNDWKSVSIDGNSALIHFMNFVDFIVDNINDSMTLYDIYDKYVYYTTPWENMGYQFRREIRYSDFAIIFSQARLAILYYMYNEENETVRTNMINKIVASLEKYQKYFNQHNFVEHPDLAICQIPGAKMEIDKNVIFRQYKDMFWFAKDTYWYIPDYQNDSHIPDLAGSIYDLVYGPDKSVKYYSTFTNNDINVFKNYYNGKYTNLYAMLEKDAGFSIKLYRTNGYMILQDRPYKESESWNNGNWYITCRAVKMTNDFNTGWYRIGDAWLQRYGFMWCKQRYKGWDTYYDDNNWYMVHINKRLE